MVSFDLISHLLMCDFLSIVVPIFTFIFTEYYIENLFIKRKIICSYIKIKFYYVLLAKLFCLFEILVFNA